jgi:hypothetical protein
VTTVRFQVSPSSQTREPPVYAMGPPVHPDFAFKSFHARIANILRRDLCRYVQYALRRWNSTPALLYVTAHRGGRGSR